MRIYPLKVHSNSVRLETLSLWGVNIDSDREKRQKKRKKINLDGWQMVRIWGKKFQPIITEYRKKGLNSKFGPCCKIYIHLTSKICSHSVKRFNKRCFRRDLSSRSSRKTICFRRWRRYEVSRGYIDELPISVSIFLVKKRS